MLPLESDLLALAARRAVELEHVAAEERLRPRGLWRRRTATLLRSLADAIAPAASAADGELAAR
jgi:hypothetical protein